MDVTNNRSSHVFDWSNFNSYFHQAGVTLIELLAALAILSILLASTLPDLSTLIANERSVVLTNRITGALAYARSTAITRQTTVITCQSLNSSTCNNSGDWHRGFITFVDHNNSKQRENDELLLRAYAAVNNGTQAIFKGSAGIKHYIKYKSSGYAFPNGSFLICNPAIGRGKALIMFRTGRLRLSKNQTNGSAVTCS